MESRVSKQVSPYPSWAQTGPRTYTQPYGFQEVLYNAISVEPGSPGLFLIASSVTFERASSSRHHGATSDELIPLFRNAWLQLRQQYPTLAAENHKHGKVYTSPSSAADLEAWLNSTFVVVPRKKWSDLFRTLVKTRQMTLYFLPDANQLFIQGEHHILDGRGLMNFWDRFFKCLSSPSASNNLFRADGSDLALLPARSDDILDTSERSPGRGKARALEILSPLSSVTSPICMPVPQPFPPFLPENSTIQFVVDTATTKAIITACKAQNLSVTAAWHSAVVLATQSVQVNTKDAKIGTEFATFANFDLRRYFPAPFNKLDIHALSNHHGVLPYVVSASGNKSLVEMSKELQVFYQQDLPKADPEVWSALGPMIKELVPEFVKPQLDETTPALSSLGVVDGFIKGQYGEWKVKELWFGDTVTGPWLEHFMWSWKGELVLNSCYNGAYYGKGDVEWFHRGIVGKLLEGLGVSGRRDRLKL